MAAALFLGLLLVSWQSFCSAEDVVGPPKIDGSYIASGEMVSKDPDGYKIQASFEETYDSHNGNAAFVVQEIGRNVTFIEDSLTGQTFRYFEKECSVMTAEEWIQVPAPPSLIGYKGDGDKIKFSLRQLFNISDTYLDKAEAGKDTEYRGIPAKSWVYNIKSEEVDGNMTMITLYAYWSKESWTTTSGVDEQIPLGFFITKLVHIAKKDIMVDTEQYINVFGFVRGSVNQKVFEPRQGIVCPDRKEIFTFPKLAVPKALSLRSEYILPDYSEIKTMDMWLDTVNGMLRVDLDRIDNQDPNSASRRFTSQITSKKLGKTFSFDVYKGKLTCNAIDISKYDMDYQELVNPKLDLKLWSFDYLIGRNTTKYVHIGKTTKRNIPCHLFQGIRKDWPTEDAGVTSLWEWCVSESISDEKEDVLFRDGEIALINAQAVITETKDEAMKNFRMIHHFYDVIEEYPTALSIATFDVSRCFKVDQQRHLQFAVDIKDVKMELIKNATSDVHFLSQWKAAISDKSGLPLETLRVTKVQSTVLDNKLYVTFLLLDIHPDLRSSGVKQASMDYAFNSLQKSVNSNGLSIKYSFDKDMSTLNAVKDTLEDVVGKPTPILPTGLPTKPTRGSTSSSSIPFTLVTGTGGPDPNTKDGTTDKPHVSTESPVSQEKVATGHSAGTVAGVTIAMLIIGFTGGAGGAFYKLRR